MNPCAFGCGEMVAKTYKRGHHFRKKHPLLMVVDMEPQTVVFSQVADLQFEGPPLHPLPIDRRRWRLAEERPGTPPQDPWLKTQCHSCLNPMWTRDPLSTWEHGGLCEECAYVVREDVGRTNMHFRDAPKFHNPFGDS